nr:MAG TPA: Neisseria meningitidis TspB protein [Inoviridae sp.]
MISHFFKSSFLCRVLCVILAALTLALSLSSSLVQPAEAVAVADDITLALGLLFTSWAGITFATNAGAQTAVSNLISSKPNVASSIAGLITKNLVTEGSKLLLTGDVKTAFRSVLSEIKDFFHVSDDCTGSLSGPIAIGNSVPVYQCAKYSDTPSSSVLRSQYFIYRLPVGSEWCLIADGVSLTAKVGSDNYLRFYKPDSSYSFCAFDASQFAVFYATDEDCTYFPYYNRSASRVYASSVPGAASLSPVSGDVSFTQSKEIDGTQVEEITWGIQFVPDPSDPTEDPNSKVYSAYSIAELLRLLKLNNSDDPGLDPEKMIEELRKLLQQQQPNPDPDPEPDPDPDPDPSDPDTPGGGDGTPPDFNGMMLPGLKDFFPFCIPFDLYNMMQALCAEPEAPKFQFATSFLGQVYTVDIDLSAWDNVAATIRYMVVAIYIVALAVATRKFIKW